MHITQISLTVLQFPGNTSLFALEEQGIGVDRRWIPRSQGQADEYIHLLRVQTNDGVEGICTVGDARYTQLRRAELEQLRLLCLGENPFDRERLAEKLAAATRTMFSRPGWWGAFDNCLWDIAGKAAGLPVYALLGRAREAAPAYYNNRGDSLEEMLDDTRHAVELGFPGVKDHFRRSSTENIAWQQAMRDAVGPGIELFHDAALADYSYADALRVGRALEELDFRWLEEPLPDTRQGELQILAAALDIPILSCETLMNDVDLSARWLISGATDLLRANARHGTTNILKLAHLAELHGTTIELNGPGGLFGLIHVHLCVALGNSSYYEYFPGGTRDEIGRQIGLLNPSLPERGFIRPPDAPGWGAVWVWGQLANRTVDVL
jgi:L-alanine-DL-glutamate epimerase-like enolase superfamily enzyme